VGQPVLPSAVAEASARFHLRKAWRSAPSLPRARSWANDWPTISVNQTRTFVRNRNARE
jgi:hypothetical protein